MPQYQRNLIIKLVLGLGVIHKNQKWYSQLFPEDFRYLRCLATCSTHHTFVVNCRGQAFPSTPLLMSNCLRHLKRFGYLFIYLMGRLRETFIKNGNQQIHHEVGLIYWIYNKVFFCKNNLHRYHSHTVHLWCDDHSTSISIYEVWGQESNSSL